MYRRFVHVAVGLWKMPQQGHFAFVIFINFTIGSVPITSVRWPSRGKFVLGLPDMLFVANNKKSLHKHHGLRMSVFGWVGRFYFCPLFVKHMAPLICCAFHGYHKVHSGHKDPTSLWHALRKIWTLSASAVIHRFKLNTCKDQKKGWHTAPEKVLCSMEIISTHTFWQQIIDFQLLVIDCA